MDQHDRRVLSKGTHCDAVPRCAWPRNSFIAAAISTTCVSMAKCPVSRNSTRAFGMSFRNASAPAGMKKGSFLPQIASNGGLLSENNPETPDKALRWTRNRETNPAECLCSPDAPAEPFQRVRFRRNTFRITHAVRVLPARSLQCQNILADYLAILRRWLSPVFPDRPPGIAKPFFIGIPVLRNDSRDSIRVSHRQTESGWCAIVEHVQCIAPDFERLRERIDCRGQSGRTNKRIFVLPELL